MAVEGISYIRWWGFSLNEGGTPVNVHASWLRPQYWLFVYVYFFGRRAHWTLARKR